VLALADAKEEELLKYWEGLGYYNRVRNMQKAAIQVKENHNGVMPTRYDYLIDLSGIGPYTAGAVASIAGGEKVAAVDGNVLRVISRLSANPTPINDGKYRKELQMRLTEIYPKEGTVCAEFTQSLFELGALICKPQNPDCERCPLQTLCKAYANGKQSLYPVIPPKKSKREERVYVFMLQTPEGFCIRRRENGVLKGMNEFPSFVSYGESDREVLNEWGVYEFTEKKRQRFTHIFTHIKWNITCIWLQTDVAPFDAYRLEEIEESISLPTAFKQCLKMIK
jgi:A/G-specific adenine glycosylase